MLRVWCRFFRYGCLLNPRVLGQWGRCVVFKVRECESVGPPRVTTAVRLPGGPPEASRLAANAAPAGGRLGTCYRGLACVWRPLSRGSRLSRRTSWRCRLSLPNGVPSVIVFLYAEFPFPFRPRVAGPERYVSAWVTDAYVWGNLWPVRVRVGPPPLEEGSVFV